LTTAGKKNGFKTKTAVLKHVYKDNGSVYIFEEMTLPEKAENISRPNEQAAAFDGE